MDIETTVLLIIAGIIIVIGICLAISKANKDTKLAVKMILDSNKMKEKKIRCANCGYYYYAYTEDKGKCSMFGKAIDDPSLKSNIKCHQYRITLTEEERNSILERSRVHQQKWKDFNSNY